MAAPESPAILDHEGSAWTRFLLVSAMLAVVGGASVGLAYAWSPPEPDAAERARAAVKTAFAEGEVRASEFSDEHWTELHAFGPMTTEAAVRVRIGGLELGDEFTRVGAKERLLVFTDTHRVVDMARIPAQAIETACMAAGLADGVSPHEPIRIQTVGLGARRVIAAVTPAASPRLTDCLRSLGAG